MAYYRRAHADVYQDCAELHKILGKEAAPHQTDTVYLKLAEDLLQKGDNEVIAVDSRNGRAYFLRGKIYFALKRFDDAIEDQATALTIDANNASA